MTHRPDQPRKLLPYVQALQRKHSDELGFLPRQSLEEYWSRGQINPAYENGDLCGFLLYYDGRNGNRPRARPDVIALHQACIQYDAQRVKHGTKLVTDLIDHAQRHRFRTIECRVRDDIPANVFWRAMGFVDHGRVLGGRRRDRRVIRWLWKPAATNVGMTFVPRHS